MRTSAGSPPIPRRSPRSPSPSSDIRFRAGDFEPAISTRLLILQPTPFCNIACDYCYLPDRKNHAVMPASTIRLATQRLRDDGLLGPLLTVVWHAGEPLVLPPGYYEDAFATVAEVVGAGCEVSHSIQTNATSLNDGWCALFKRHNVRVGVSVDGPAFIHDRHRRTRRGGGTHLLVERGLETLRRHGVPHHAIAVVTADSLAHADPIHSFFVSHHIHEVGFNCDETEGSLGTSSLATQEEAHGKFVQRMLQHMITSGGTYQVRELVNAFRLIEADPPCYRWRGDLLPENLQTIPFGMISVAWSGDFSTFSPELLGQPSPAYDNFILGNVRSTGYIAAADGEAFRSLWAAVRAGVAACRASCAYFDYCGGGAPANKLYENGGFDTGETLYCRTMIQRPFDAVLRLIEQESTRGSCDASN